MQSVEQITSLLLEKSKATKNQNVRDLMSNILSKKKDAAYHTGFIISERFVNVPPEIAPPLLENLR